MVAIDGELAVVVVADGRFDALGAQVAPQATASRAEGEWQRSGR